LKAVVLAAGKGTRLKPLTSKRPKHLLPVIGLPLLSHLFDRIKDVGITEVIVITKFKEHLIKNFYKKNPIKNLSIKFITQKDQIGTADAFKSAQNHVDDDFLGIYGDLYLTSKVLNEVLNSHRKGENIICSVPVQDPSRYGVLNIKNDFITEIIEKPIQGSEPSNLANAGVYIFNKKVFEYIKETELSERKEYEITDTLRNMIRSGEVVKTVKIKKDEWLDIGLPWNLFEANERALRFEARQIEGKIEENVRLIGKVVVLKGSRIRSGTYIEGPVFIDKESDIGPNSYIRPSSYIGKKTRIGSFCEVKNSIIMDESHIAHLSYIGDSIIGERCNLGAGTITANLRFDKKEIRMNIRGTLVNSRKRKLVTMMGDDAQTGINVGIWPGIKIGNNSWIAPGVTVTRDVPDSTVIRNVHS
jgi:bifunctional UDP-N-acetylglucosamine pyrophosphorylase/glucosamine-1-phosphate N-acetyltransferase